MAIFGLVRFNFHVCCDDRNNAMEQGGRDKADFHCSVAIGLGGDEIDSAPKQNEKPRQNIIECIDVDKFRESFEFAWGRGGCGHDGFQRKGPWGGERGGMLLIYRENTQSILRQVKTKTEP